MKREILCEHLYGIRKEKSGIIVPILGADYKRFIDGVSIIFSYCPKCGKKIGENTLIKIIHNYETRNSI